MSYVKLRPFGGIDSDSHVQDIADGNYTDAKNIEFVNQAEGLSKAATPAIGNEFAFDLGSVDLQDKWYAIVFPDGNAPAGGYELSVYRQGGQSLLIPVIEITSFITAPQEITDAMVPAGYPVTVTPISQLGSQFANIFGWVIKPALYSPTLRYYDYGVKSSGDNLLDVQVVQEAISKSRTGELEVIASGNIIGIGADVVAPDLFVLSTSKRSRPTKFDIASISVLSNHVIQLAPVSQDIDVEDGSEIFISGVEGVPEANGLFIANLVYTPTGTFVINLFNSFAPIGSTYVTGTGKALANPYGIGELGVAQKDVLTGSWKYTRLFRTTKWNLTTYNRVMLKAQLTGDTKNIYFVTWDGDPPRAFYYKHDAPYVTNGAVRFWDSEGRYDYDSASEQTRHILGQPSFDIDFIEQPQTGGGLFVGGHRYFCRGVLRDGSRTDWSLPSNEVIVYSELTSGNPVKIKGDIEGTQTSKANIMEISNINSDLFDYIEVAAINYLSIAADTTTYGVFAKLRVERGQSRLRFTHTGREVGEDLNPDELSVQTQTYDRARYNALIDNRYVLFDLGVADVDLTEFFGKAKYELRKKEISRVGAYPLVNYGGHQDPDNVFRYTGFMINETYKFMGRVKFVGGYTTPLYNMGLVKFDTEATSADGKRLAGLSNYDLVAFQGGDYVPYIAFSGLDARGIDVEGIPLSSLIERVEIFYAEVQNPTILGYGMALMHVQCVDANSQNLDLPGNTDPVIAAPFWAVGGPFEEISYTRNIPGGSLTISPNGRGLISYEFPFLAYNQASPAGAGSLAPVGLALPLELLYKDIRYTANQGLFAGQDNGYYWNDRYASLYMIDDLVRGAASQISPGDKVISFGSVYGTSKSEDNTKTPSNWLRVFTPTFITGTSETSIEIAKVINSGEYQYVDGVLVTKAIGIASGVDNECAYFNTGVVVKTDAAIQGQPSIPDRGIRLIQVRREIQGDQYSPSNFDACIYTGAKLTVFDGREIEVFGGDAYTTHTYLRNFVQVKDPVADPLTGVLAQGLNLTTQSRTNPYMLYKQDDVPLWPYDEANDGGPNVINLSTWFDNRSTDQFYYNSGYNIRLEMGYRTGFDPKYPVIKNYWTRSIWSDEKPQGSVTDIYRRFGNLSYCDIEPSPGELTGAMVLNGELFTLQPKGLRRHFFNTRSTLTMSDKSAVVLGDAGVMSRPAALVTEFGCSHPASVVIGKSKGGDDLLYYFNQLNNQFMRFGPDGAIPISDRAQYRARTLSLTRWLSIFNSPTHDFGIHGVWNQRLKQVIWTIRSYRKQDYTWAPGLKIQQGDVVVLSDETNFMNFEQTPVVYVATADHESSNSNKPGPDAKFWNRPDITDLDYYSIRTIIWSEEKNKFVVSDVSAHPRIYLPYSDTYLSPNPISPRSRVYEHNRGEILVWYKQANPKIRQQEEGFVEVVFNINPDDAKQMLAILSCSELAPKRCEFWTKNHHSVIPFVDFLEQLDSYQAPIPNDLLNGSTGEDNTFVYGEWCRVRIYVEPGEAQRITNVILKFNYLPRLSNT